ncbi:NADPH-dependent 7-cyano-7-deazaguanine reductase QueF [Simkania negevensis]|uniref:NADPH-dependent 7-cyano-7-deazaguanine reductase QueF n=1 Tax=Simkania negevensis TaxID=83561 RepID=A0ABS3AS43_9BACT|nr:NADPH-dependent 7-cyano-7-deazaguanine reductase QueF [Simkania negevensis]
MADRTLQYGPLGQRVEPLFSYEPSLLFPIKRSLGRKELGLAEERLPFTGSDAWNAYELAFLDLKGKPCVGIVRVTVPCNSPYLFESKSFKLYLNSFNMTRFDSFEEVQSRIEHDLSAAIEKKVSVVIVGVNEHHTLSCSPLEGSSLDELEIEVDSYEIDPSLLCIKDGEEMQEKFYTHLFRSKCPMTGQPDWATLFLHYRGPKINTSSLLRYLVSYRDHSGFHEQCVERIFVDIKKYCRSHALSVLGCFNRRGGIDINPFRSDFEEQPPLLHIARQ